MRPNKPGPTRTLPARCRGITRALGASPCTSPVGIMSSLSPEKPTTSASQREPSLEIRSQTSPTAAWQPEASSASPTMRVSEPSTGGDGRLAARATCVSMLLRQPEAREARNALAPLMPALPAADRPARRWHPRARRDRPLTSRALPRRCWPRSAHRCSPCQWSRGSHRVP